MKNKSITYKIVIVQIKITGKIVGTLMIKYYRYVLKVIAEVCFKRLFSAEVLSNPSLEYSIMFCYTDADVETF